MIFFKRHLFLFSSVVLIFVSTIPRAIEILSGNYLFGFDQGLFYQAVRSIVIDRHLTLIGAEVGGIGGFFQGPGWYYLLIIPFVLFREDPYGGMVLMLLLGVLTVFLSVFLFRKDLGTKSSLLIGFFIGLSPGIISQSRFIWPPFVITPLTVFLLYSVVQSYNGRKYFIPLIFFTIGIMSHFEIATAGTLLLPTVAALLFVRPKNYFSLQIITLSVFGFLVTQTTLIFFDIRHHFIGMRGILAFITHGSNTKSAYNFFNHTDMFKDALFSTSYTWYMICILIFASIYSIILMKKDNSKDSVKKFKLIKFLLLSLIFLFLITLPIRSTLWSWWFLEVSAYLCFLFGILLSYLLSKQSKLVIAVLIIFSLLFINQAIAWYKNDFNDLGGTAKIKGKIQAIDYIYNDAHTKNFGLFVFTPPVYTYPYDYILEWYGKNKYNYIPPQEKKSLFYLLVEPDPEKQWSYKGWMETVIKDGKVEKTVKLQNGFIIQKRVLSSK